MSSSGLALRDTCGARQMAIKLDCPRCKKPLSVPSKKIGRYVNCPQCSGRFWVPENAAGGGSAGAVSAPGGPASGPPKAAGQLPATISTGDVPTVSPSGVVPEPPAGQNTPVEGNTGAAPAGGGGGGWQVVPPSAPPAGPTPAVQPPGSGQKTARFVSAEAAQSTLKLAEDGNLPELHLLEGERKAKEEEKSSTVSPLVLFGLLAISVALSIGLVWLDTGPPKSGLKEDARREVADRFFPRQGEDSLEYQRYLMKAQEAHKHGNREVERKAYQKVLDLLRQERPPYIEHDKPWSVTRNPQDDEDLKDLISTLLNDE